MKNDPWAHRSKGMRCVSCMWFIAKANEAREDGVLLGRCRRGAPTMDGFPAVFEDDWCGRHKLTLPVVQEVEQPF